TVDQALEALDPPLGDGIGLALDSYHLNIEERSPAAAILTAGPHLRVMQDCGNDRGQDGGADTDWNAILDALDEVSYTGPLTVESFTSDNDTIAVAASVWRRLADSQDELARASAEFLGQLQRRRTGGAAAGTPAAADTPAAAGAPAAEPSAKEQQ